jgi:hypothetical protein
MDDIMSAEPIHTYDFSKIEVFEAGASLLTLLAYPGENCENERNQLHISLCALAVRATYPSDTESAFRPQLIKPIYAFRTEREIKRDLRTLRRRHRDRMIAGRMAIAFLKKANGITPKLAGGDERLSIKRISELVLEDAGYTEPENVETRIWRPSLPAIHLAAAIQILLNESPTPIGAGDLLHHRPLIEWVVRSAEEFESVFACSRNRGIDASKLIKVRLAA